MSTQLLMVLNLLYDVKNSNVNVGMPRKVSPASALLMVINCVIPASRSVRHRSPSCDNDHMTHYILKLNSYYLFLLVNLLAFRI
jgi:hypothetical protein